MHMQSLLKSRPLHSHYTNRPFVAQFREAILEKKKQKICSVHGHFESSNMCDYSINNAKWAVYSFYNHVENFCYDHHS